MLEFAHWRISSEEDVEEPAESPLCLVEDENENDMKKKEPIQKVRKNEENTDVPAS